MKTEYLIVGLGEIGASIGLALAEVGAEGVRTGYDRDSKAARLARKAGAVERLALSLERGCQGADLVVLAVRSAEVCAYLEVIAPRLKSDAVVLDTSPLKSAAISWAVDHFPEGRYCLGAVPVVSPTVLHTGPLGEGSPRADLFQGGLLGIVLPPRTPESVVDLVINLARIIGASPFFLEAVEVDAATATVEDLPTLLAAVLVRVAVQTSGWRDARRMAGRLFASQALVSALESPENLRASLALNRANVVNRLDGAIAELGALRKIIAEGDDEGLASLLDETAEAYGAWLSARHRGNWEEDEQTKIELPKGGTLDRLLGIGGRPRPKDRKQ